MSQTNETAGMRPLSFAQAIVDEAANRNVRLIKTGAASQHAGIDSGCIHHADMRAEIGKQRIEQIMRIAVAVEIGRCFAGFALEQFWRRVMLLKIDKHFSLRVANGERKSKSLFAIHYSPF